MPSPFPGMNPYLERAGLWQDFHTRFLSTVADSLATQIRDNYLVRIEEHVYIRELPPELWRPLGRPDIALTRRPDAGAGTVAVAPVIDQGEEIELKNPIDEIAQRFLEIRDRKKREVVTVIELLSPSNKTHNLDRDQYLKKRLCVLAGAANLVEIDLLRGGPRLPLDDPPRTNDYDYYVFISRAPKRPKMWLRRIKLRERLPVIPIPLRPDDGEAHLDLQAMVNRVYDAGTYDAEIYDSPPEPPLNADDATWAAQFVPAERTGD